MRKPRPFQWIEEAEARQVLARALADLPQAAEKPSWLLRVRRLVREAWPRAVPSPAHRPTHRR
jgi:hypothetical protein